MTQHWMGIDIGGANIKLANTVGFAKSFPFELWRTPESLGDTLATILNEAPSAENLAVTMTGELADCYESKAEGVESIVRAVQYAAPDAKIAVYLHTGSFVAPEEAITKSRQAAASNWHALAALGCRHIDQRYGLVIDCGSTTTDIIPTADGRPAVEGVSDVDRLQRGQLVYTGVGRSPLCGLLSYVDYRGVSCPVAQEWFATAADAYLLLGKTSEDAKKVDTADGKPSTIESAVLRMGRMLCCDRLEFSLKDAETMAEEVLREQMKLISTGLEKVISEMTSRPTQIVTSGQGEFLIEHVLDTLNIGVNRVSLSKILDQGRSIAAPAYAVAELAKHFPFRS